MGHMKYPKVMRETKGNKGGDTFDSKKHWRSGDHTVSHNESSKNFGRSSTMAKTPMKKDQSRMRPANYSNRSYD